MHGGQDRALLSFDIDAGMLLITPFMNLKYDDSCLSFAM